MYVLNIVSSWRHPGYDDEGHEEKPQQTFPTSNLWEPQRSHWSLTAPESRWANARCSLVTFQGRLTGLCVILQLPKLSFFPSLSFRSLFSLLEPSVHRYLRIPFGFTLSKPHLISLRDMSFSPFESWLRTLERKPQ